MRCDEVIRELSTPSDQRDERALTRHLENCESCAIWEEKARRFDRLWELTAPAEPSPEAWDRVWNSVAAQLDGMNATQDEVAPIPMPRPRVWSKVAIVGGIILAQAAAILIAVSLSWSPVEQPGKLDAPPSNGELAVSTATSPSLDTVFDLDEGEVVYLRSQGTKVEPIDLTDLEMFNGEDPWYVFFNRVESANSVVVLSE